MGLRDIESKLPPGFRFYPSDEELVCHYLCKKITREMVWEGTMVEVDLHTCEPWELPDIAKLTASEWYFFSFRDRKYSTGSRTNRATKTGYWKATGKDKIVHDPSTQVVVGMRKTLVFYHGRAPNGIKTAWVMHEFRLETPHMPPKEDWVLCRVFNKRKEETLEEDNMQDTYNNFTYPTIMDSSLPIYPHQPTLPPPRGLDLIAQPECYVPNPYTNMSLLQYNFHGLPTHDMPNTSSFGSRLGDEYGFLMDLELEEHDIGGGASSSGYGIAFSEDLDVDA